MTRRSARGPDRATGTDALTSDLPRLWRAVGALGAATVVVFASVLLPPVQAAAQAVDEVWHRWMVALHWDRQQAVFAVLSELGTGWVLVPLRTAVAGWLAVRRRWDRLAVWVLAIALSEPAIRLLKALYARARPPLPLEAADTWSFPSGHAVGGAVIAITLVVVLTRPGPARWRWWAVALAWSVTMAVSRTYLRVHWLTDVVAGTLLGVTLGLLSVALVASYRPGSRRPRWPRVGRAREVAG